MEYSEAALWMQQECMKELAMLIEISYDEIGNHIVRTQYFIKLLAYKLLEQGYYQDELSEDAIDWIAKSALVHDIGKAGLPSAILRKPGKLTKEEYDIVKTHTTLGLQIINHMEQKHQLSQFSFIRYAKEVAYYHHEWWNGEGYPLGVKELQIPLSARLMALADVYDALMSKRVYKDAFSHEFARNIIVQNAGIQFDPLLVEMFLQAEDQFQEIFHQYKDDAKQFKRPFVDFVV